MVKFLRWLFFHTGFWTRAAGRFWGLLLRRKKLKINSLGIDQAFYFEGSNIVLKWEVENAWLIRVNHPGGFYRHSDLTWLIARTGMEPIRITVWGIGKRVRHEFPVRVKPYTKRDAATRIASAEPLTSAIHEGPRLSSRAKAIATQRLRIKADTVLLPSLPEQATSLAIDLQAIRQSQHMQDFSPLRAHLLGKYALSPETNHPSNDSHGTE